MARICIVTEEFSGLTKSGGIGTAATALGIYLRSIGHQIDVIITNSLFEPTDDLETENINFFYLKNIIAKDNEMQVALSHAGKSLHVYRFVKFCGYDLIYFNEWQASGFHTALARRQGLLKSIIITYLHGSSEWVRRHNQNVPTLDQFEVEAMERKQIENSDYIVSPSKYIVEWYKASGIRIENYKLIGWLLPQWLKTPPKNLDYRFRTKSVAGGQVKTLVFFGRHERRKGFELFVDALCLLPKEISPSIIFLGSPGVIDYELTLSYLFRKLKKYNNEIELISHFSQTEAMLFLHETVDSLCIIPSLTENYPCVIGECLTQGVPFISTTVGGIPEMIAVESASQCLVSPDARVLADKIVEVLELGLPQITSSFSPWEVIYKWRQFHDELPLSSSAPTHQISIECANPKVSICITHFERPQLLANALKHIFRQTFANIEIIIVDDGSKGIETHFYLDKISKLTHLFPLKIIKTENIYLGAARNLAAKYATGDFLLFHDDDNFLEPNAVDTFVSASLHSNTDILTSHYYVFTDDILKDQIDLKIKYVFTGLGGLASYFTNRFGDANALIKRKVFWELGGFSEKRNTGYEDWEFFLKASLRNASISVIPEVLFNYRESSTGMLGTGRPYNDFSRIFDMLEIEAATISSDLMRLVASDQINTHTKHKMIQKISQEPYYEFLLDVNESQIYTAETFEKLSNYLLAMGRAKDALKIKARFEDNTHTQQDHFQNYSFNLVNNFHSNTRILDSSVLYSRNTNLSFIRGWIWSDSVTHFDFTELDIDGSYYKVCKKIREKREDVARHLGLSDGCWLGFKAIVQERSNNQLLLPWKRKKDQKINIGVASGADAKKISIYTDFSNVKGFIDEVINMASFKISNIDPRFDDFVQICTNSSERPYAVLIRDKEIDFGHDIGHGRLQFLLTGNSSYDAIILFDSNNRYKITMGYNYTKAG